jgi:putative MATE family efflux protein
MTHHNPLGTEKIRTLLIRFSIPAIIGMLVSALYNIVDRIFIGNAADIGKNGLAGITIGFPLMLITLALGVLFGIGGATLFSMRLGQKREQEAEKVLGNAFILIILSGTIYTLFGQVFLEPLLKLFGASATVLPYSMDYMRIIYFGVVFQMLSMGLNHFIRADGSPKIAMYTMFLGAGINIVLDPLFIYVFKMGMGGAAWATIIAQGVSATWVVLYFFGKRSRMKLHLKNFILSRPIVIKIMSLGLPGFLLQLAGSLLNTLLNRNLLMYGGDVAVSGMGVINSIQTLMLMPIIGLNQGVQPLVSFNFGAERYDRVKQAIKLAMIAATMIVTFGFIITRIFPKQLVSMFNQDPELLIFGDMAIYSWFLMLPLVGFQIIGANFFQAIGRSKSAMFLTLTRQIIFLIPAVLFFPRIWGIQGLLYAAPFADVLSTLLTGIFFFMVMKDLTHLHHHANQEPVIETFIEV